MQKTIIMNKRIDKDNIKVNLILKDLLSHIKNIDNVLQSNDNITNINCYLYITKNLKRHYKDLKDYRPYSIDIHFEYKDNNTIKYCKEYTKHLFDYCKTFDLLCKPDYESSIVKPYLTISSKKELD